MKTLNRSLLFILILSSFSCDDILEEDITNDAIQIVAPIEGTVIEGNTVQFSWKELDGADDYRIQIIKSNQVFEVDSLVATNTFKYILNSGTYQWRVKGVNFAYNTAYTFPVNFSVEASDDLSIQNVVLLTPSNNFYTNGTSLIFTWSQLENATYYSFELIKNLSGEQTVVQEPNITLTSYTANSSVFDEDAKYIWKVKALNGTSETSYSQRSIFIDRVQPNQPSLSSPADQSMETTTVTFNWTNGVDTGNVKSAITNTIEIASDADFNTVIHLASTQNNTYQYEFGATGTYYWRIKAVDEATNESDYSTVRSVVVQ
ncbi:MAG TPA: hypothetical protein VF985_04900 [Mariniflexile sp.]|jgi:hypothetical protein